MISPEKTADAEGPLAGSTRLGTAEIVAADACVRIDEAQRARLLDQVVEDTREQGVLHHVGEVAGVERMAVVHERPRITSPGEPRPAAGKTRGRSPDMTRSRADPS